MAISRLWGRSLATLVGLTAAAACGDGAHAPQPGNQAASSGASGHGGAAAGASSAQAGRDASGGDTSLTATAGEAGTDETGGSHGGMTARGNGGTGGATRGDGGTGGALRGAGGTGGSGNDDVGGSSTNSSSAGGDGGEDNAGGDENGGMSTAGAGVIGGGAGMLGGAGTAGLGGYGGSAGAAGSAGTAGLAGTAGSAAGSSGTVPVIALSGLSIDANPNMSISCFVSWHTDAPADSEVDFGAGSYAFRIRDQSLVTDHRVLVIGMHADTQYLIKALSSGPAGSGSAEGTFTTGLLPANLPIPTLTADDFEHSQVGWTLLNLEVGTASPARIVMFDQEGLPVWYFIDGTHNDDRGDVANELRDGQILVGPKAANEPARVVSLSGDIVWEGPANSLAQEQTHEFAKLTNGNFLYNLEIPPAASDAQQIRDQILEELTPDRSVAWSWRLFEHVPKAGSRYELCHGNALHVDEATNMAYYNCRFLGIFKIDRASGDIEWRLGGTFDTTSLGPGDFTFSPPESQFSDVHDPEYHADGTVLVYDNGGYGNLPAGSTYHSRVVEYQLDQINLTATRTFEFPGSFDVDDWYKNVWYTPIWGRATRLDNGNILVTAGTRQANANTRIIEITRQGKVVWELTFPKDTGAYRSQRLSPPPLVEALQ
jgi:hypothetical protein